MEKWIEAYGFEKYEVSNLGNVRNKRTKRVLSQRPSRNSYMAVDLYREDGSKTTKYVHQLIMFSFNGVHENYGNQKGKYVIDHKDNNHLNNRLDNLQYLKFEENAAKISPLKGQNNPNNKLTEEQAREIKALKGIKLQKEIAKEFNVSLSLVQKIHQNKIWTWL